MEEEAKAVQELSKLGVKTIETVEDFAKYFGELTGLNSDGDIVGIIKDKTKYLRSELQCRMAIKYNEKYANQKMKPIPPKFLIPILENGSLEANPDLQDLWIDLLGSFTNESYKEERRVAYIDILKSLSPLDVKLLGDIYDFSQKSNSEIMYIGHKLNKQNLKDYKNIIIERPSLTFDVGDFEYFESVDNLCRLGCLKIANTHGKSPDYLNLTYMGAGLVEACINLK